MIAKKISIRNTIKAAQKAEKAGELEIAASHYALVVRQFPNHPTASKRLKKLHKMLTGSAGLSQNDVNQLVAQLQSGEIIAAVDTATRLICIAPKEAVLHNILGIALLQLSETEAAERAFRKAIRLRPDYPEALGNLGTLLGDEGKQDEALLFLRKALNLNPHIPEANNSMGLILCQRAQYNDALVYSDTAIAANPKYPDAYNTKGLTFKEMGDLSGAIEAFEAGLNIDPSDTGILTNLAYTLWQADRETEAAEILEQVATQNPKDLSEIQMRLSIIQSQLGEREKALASIRDAISSDPGNAEARRIHSMTTRFKKGDPEITEMENILSGSPNDPDTRMHLGFALGKAFEDIGNPQEAFKYWAIGNRERRNNLPYSIDDDRKLCAKIQSVFRQEFVESFEAVSNPSKQPIFIVGMMRSGTTLVEQILSSHSQVFGAGELSFVNDHVRKLITEDNVDSASIREFSDSYLDYSVPEARLSPRVVDKMPINFLWIGYIKAAFPNVKIINLSRDPRDVALSIFKNYFIGSGNQYAYDLNELAEFYLLYHQMMLFWHQELPGAVYDISYEALVRDFEGEARKLLTYCELDWENQILSFQKTQRVVKTASVAQVREPIYSKSVEGWRRFETELRPFISILENAGLLAKPG
jgi:tetratricopeptide (TPR) repeat protein